MRFRVVVLVAVAAVALCGCSPTQVRAWFAFYKHQDVSLDYATNLANTLNAKIPPGCDENYAGQCVPNNVLDVDCAGGSGDGPAYVTGPVTVTGWDHYELDANHDGVGCEPS